MKKILLAAISAAFSTTVYAGDDGKLSIGGGYGLGNGGVISIHGDYDISAETQQPIKVRVGYDHYSTSISGFGATWDYSYNVFYGGAYYDFGKLMKLDSKMHPFGGLGFGFGSAKATCTGAWCAWAIQPSVTVGGFYYIGGLQYDITPSLSAEVNFNTWGGVTLGGNFKF